MWHRIEPIFTVCFIIFYLTAEIVDVVAHLKRLGQRIDTFRLQRGRRWWRRPTGILSRVCSNNLWQLESVAYTRLHTKYRHLHTSNSSCHPNTPLSSLFIYSLLTANQRQLLAIYQTSAQSNVTHSTARPHFRGDRRMGKLE